MKVLIKPHSGCCNVGLSLDSPWDVVDGNTVQIDGDLIQVFKLQKGNKTEFVCEQNIQVVEDTSSGIQSNHTKKLR